MGRGRGWGKEGNILERKESKREKLKKMEFLIYSYMSGEGA